MEAAVLWLGRAQDCSASRDGGVAHSFDLRRGWAASYPETTGYIVPTLLGWARAMERPEAVERARRMLDWLVSIQMPSGAFPGGTIDQPPVPVAFNTGQILMGLAAGARHFDEPRYLEGMHRAARWLVQIQDQDGAWRRCQSPFAMPGVKAYDTHVAWGLLEAHRVAPQAGYARAALANVDWALGQQRPNGWFEGCCLTDASRPLTHTLAYALRGVLEAWRHSNRQEYLSAAIRTADGLASAMDGKGFLPGRLRRDWGAGTASSCLTGTAQSAICWFILADATGDQRYANAARLGLDYLCRTVNLHGDPGVRGGLKGSFPVDGDYAPYLMLNWAAKFFVDACLAARAHGAEA
jgi:uncharacterized protein YyaL (SSP411 family)